MVSDKLSLTLLIYWVICCRGLSCSLRFPCWKQLFNELLTTKLDRSRW